MNKVLLTLLGLVALTSAASVPQGDIAELVHKSGISGRGIILSSEGKKIVEKFIKNLKPYTKDEIVLTLKKSIAEIDVKISNFTVDNLNEAAIKKLTIDYTFGQKVKFNFLIPKVVITGQVSANATIEVLKSLGINIKRKLEGDLELILENVTFKGAFKYTWPLIIFNSIKIYDFDGSIVVGSVVSKIDGIYGGAQVDQLFNSAVEVAVMKYISSNQEKISEILKDTLVPFANSKLEGKNIWTIIG